MKIIKVFLASSAELENERLRLDQTIKELNENVYNKKGFQIKMFTWETHDRQLRTKAKQEEYNEHVRESDMFLGLFWTKAGKFTLEEFDIALAQYKATEENPAIYIYFKEVEVGQEDYTLQEFKNRIIDREKGESYYATNFSSIDRVKYEFTVELMRLECDGALKSLKVENTAVKFDGYEICNISSLPFASNNEERVKLVEAIIKLKRFIDKYKDDDDEDMQYDVRKKRAKLEKLEKELITKDEALLDMSIDFVRRVVVESSAQLLEARDAFLQGDMKRVRELTKLSDIDTKIQVKQEFEKALNDDFERLLISRNAIIEDSSISIEERIKHVEYIYERLMLLLKELHKDEAICAAIIFDYAQFAKKHAKYDKAKELYLEQISLCKKIYGEESIETANSYNNIGEVYQNEGNITYENYTQMLDYYYNALTIRLKILGEWHYDTAISYNNIGYFYFLTGDYSKALERYFKALIIFKELLGEEHALVATSLNRIGDIYDSQGKYDKAFEYYSKALQISKKSLGDNHPTVAVSWNNIGDLYFNKCSTSDVWKYYPKALECYIKALAIREKTLGKQHPNTKTIQKRVEHIASELNK